MKWDTLTYTVFVLLNLLEVVLGLASGQRKPTRSPTIPMLGQSNSTSLSSIAGPLNSHASPPDPWTYPGPKRKYKFSGYRNPGVNLGWLATFLLTCMGDIFDATATQGFKPDEPYPDGVYNCYLRYFFPHGKPVIFALEMKKTEAPDWSMTFSDVADDLEALWYAALWFEGRATGFPELYFGVYEKDASLPVSRGNFKFTVLDMANVSSAY